MSAADTVKEVLAKSSEYTAPVAAFMEDLAKKSFGAFFAQVSKLNVPELQAVGKDIIRESNPDLPADYPTQSWPMARFDHALIVAVAYLVFVIVVGGIFRLAFGAEVKESKDGKKKSVLAKFAAEPLTLLQAVYNPLQVYLCGWMIYAAIKEYQAKNYSFICNPMNYSETGMAAVVWVFYLSKIFDFFDTVFIIFRRKWTQLSFLHVYHHFSIFMFYWLNINAGYDGDVYYTVILNSFIHLVMYFYYFCTTLNVKVPGAIKFMVTNMQMIQFVTMMSQAVYILLNKCAYPNRITLGYLIYIFSLLVLFLNFSRKTYGKKDAKDAKDGSGGKTPKKDTKKTK